MTERKSMNEVIAITDLLPKEEWEKISESDESVNEYLKQYGWTRDEFEAEFVKLFKYD